MFTAKVGSRTGASKSSCKGTQQVGKRTTDVTIWDFDVMEGYLNVYGEIEDYLKYLIENYYGTYLFFLRAQVSSANITIFFTSRPVDRNIFNKKLKATCVSD